MSALLWGNPLGWLGAAAVAVPILVHLLATFRARRVPFPTLRFLPESMPAAMRARRIEDRRLLLLRCLIIVVAVAALAQPWLVIDGRDAEGGGARAVVIDISDSVGRPTASGEPGLEVARATARILMGDASTATSIETADLAAGIAAARAWLATGSREQRSAAEVVVISDFQLGALASADLSLLPETTGIRLVKVAVESSPEIDLPLLHRGGRAIATSLTREGTEWLARWREAPQESDGNAPGIAWLAAADEAAGADAAAAASERVVPVPQNAVARPVTVVWPGAPELPALRAAALPPDEPWMAEVLAALPVDSSVTAASHDSRLLLFADDEPGGLASASLMASLRRSAGTSMAALAELEPAVIEDAVLRGWERAAIAEPSPTGSDGRWLWLIVLGLLLLEQWVRHNRAAVGGPVVG